MTETTGYTTMVGPTEDTRFKETPATRSTPATSGNPASDFVLPKSMQRVIHQHAAEVARRVGDAIAEKKKTAAFHERMRTDVRFKGAFRDRAVKYAAKHGISETKAYAPVLAAFLEEF